MGDIRDGVEVAVLLALEHLGDFPAQEDLGAEGRAVLVALDPGIRKGEVRQATELAVGDVEGQIPGASKEVAVLELDLTKDALALAVADTAREGASGLLHHPEDDGDGPRLTGHGAQGDLDVTKQARAVEALDVVFQLAAVEGVAGLDRNLPGDHPGFGFAADRLALVVRAVAFLVEELHFNTSHGALTHQQLHHTSGADAGGARHPSQGIPLIGVPLLQLGDARLQGVEIQGFAVVRGKDVGKKVLGKLGARADPLELHLGEHRVRHDGDHQPHPQGAIDRLDADIREPATGVDRREVGLQFAAGDAAAGASGHRVVHRDLHPLLFRVALGPLNHHLTDQNPRLRGGGRREGLARTRGKRGPNAGRLRRRLLGRCRILWFGTCVLPPHRTNTSHQRQRQCQPQAPCVVLAVAGCSHGTGTGAANRKCRRTYLPERGAGQAAWTRLRTSP